MSPCKLDSCFHSFTSRGAEECPAKPPTRTLAQFLSQFAGEICNMGLDHRWTATLQFCLQGGHYVRMIMSRIVNAVSRKEVEYEATLGGKEFSTQTSLVAHIHLQQIQQPDPRWIDPFGIPLRCPLCVFDLDRCTHGSPGLRFYGVNAIEVGALPIEYVETDVSVPLLPSRLNDCTDALAPTNKNLPLGSAAMKLG